METPFIRTQGLGSGNEKRYRPSKAAVGGIVKRSGVTIENKDTLCCARAIVTMKALVDADGNTLDPDYRNLKQGNPAEERKAKALHKLAGLPEGPCDLPEGERFQTALQGYQIKVMSIDPAHMIIYAGSTPSDKIIRLINEGEHYDGCNSFGGFLSRSHFCDDCSRGFDQDDMTHHCCNDKCFLQTKRLPRFHRRQTTPGTWSVPHANFTVSIMSPKILRRPVLQLPLAVREPPHQIRLRLVQKVPGLQSRLRTRPQGASRWRSRPRHVCGWGECHICLKKVHLATHKCYIQRLQEDVNNPNMKRVPRHDVGSRPFKEPEPNDAYTRVFVEK